MPIKRIPKDKRSALEITPPASKPDNIIGIDPDVDRSGVAWLHPDTRDLECHALPFPELLDYLQYAKKSCQENNQSLVVVVEAGWLNTKRRAAITPPEAKEQSESPRMLVRITRWERRLSRCASIGVFR